jgi:hypothetical protein
MQTSNLKSVILFVAATSAASLVIQACGGGPNAAAQAASDADPIEGVWESAVSIRDCASGAVVRTFKGVTQFMRGGAAAGTNNQPPATQGPAFGVWKRNATGATYTASYRFFRYNPDGTVAGTQKLTRTLSLAADGNSSTGNISAQVLDNAETVLQTICGTDTAVRLF